VKALKSRNIISTIDREGGRIPLIRSWLKSVEVPKQEVGMLIEEDVWQTIRHFGEITLEERRC
jgi:hypothetical protein